MLNYLIISEIFPEPTVLPPSRIEKLVPFSIRKEAFEINLTKEEARKKIVAEMEKLGYTFNGWKMEYTVAGSVRTEKVSTTYYGKEWRAPGSNVKFVAQWTATTSATIYVLNPYTGKAVRYTFDPTQDYTMPADSTSLMYIDGVYYKFDGWYTSLDYTGEPVTVIPANTFDIANSKYYSKWSPVTEGVN